MAEYNTEGIVISAMMITAFFTTLLLFYEDATDKYTVNNYYAENLTEYTQIADKVQEDAQQIQEASADITSGNLADIFGGLVQGILGIFGILINSFTGIGTMFAQSIGLFDIGEAGTIWSSVAVTGVILIFILGIKLKTR